MEGLDLLATDTARPDAASREESEARRLARAAVEYRRRLLEKPTWPAGPRRPEDEPYILWEPLAWKNILEFEFKAVRLISYKGRVRKERIVRASVELERGLRKLYIDSNPKPDDLLFPIKSFKRSWTTLCESVGLTNVWIRDFRHYFNSRILQMREFNDMERMLLLGHENLKTNRIYSQLDMRSVDKFRAATSGPIIESDAVN